MFDMGAGIGGMIGAGINYFSQMQTNEANKSMADNQMHFQEAMSNTAYQRARADMEKAGLNPMMMFGSGSAASSPAGASANLQAPKVDTDIMERAVSTAVKARVADATIDNLVEQNAKLKAETVTEKWRAPLVAGQAATEGEKPYLVRAQADTERSRAVITREAIASAVNQAITAKNESEISPGARRILDMLGYGGRKASDIVSPVGAATSAVQRARGRPAPEYHYHYGE